MGDLKVFDSWYKALIAAGVALGVAAVAAHHNQLLVIAIGLVFLGVGEFKNHPQVSDRINEGFGGFNGIRTYRMRIASPSGTIMGIIGVGLVGYGIIRLLAIA